MSLPWYTHEGIATSLFPDSLWLFVAVPRAEDLVARKVGALVPS